MKLSVLIVAYNEAHNISDAVESVHFADEIIVLDNASEDDTGEIARQKGAKVIASKENMGFAEGKVFALKYCAGEWVLWLDADERVTQELQLEILEVIDDDNNVSAYRMPRRSFFLNRWMKCCGWYPDYVIRLFKRNCARFSDHLVHEQLIVDGNVATMKNNLLHYTDRTLDIYLHKLNRYSTLSAREMYGKGRKARLSDILIRPFLTFIKNYFAQKGFADGLEGFLLSVLNSVYVLAKYTKLYYMYFENQGKK